MEENFKYLEAGERGGLKEYGSEDKPTLQKREANYQERKLKKGRGKKKHFVKEGTNVLKEIK